ncbi:MAG: hypothetical protein VKJ06_05570 [Vampirovibrionales bacterium]|nr:hypothetical protein [Vampirovibrionales bacterium]
MVINFNQFGHKSISGASNPFVAKKTEPPKAPVHPPVTEGTEPKKPSFGSAPVSTAANNAAKNQFLATQNIGKVGGKSYPNALHPSTIAGLEGFANGKPPVGIA